MKKKKAKKAAKNSVKKKSKSMPKKSNKKSKKAKTVKKKKSVNRLSGEKLFRDKEFTTGYRDPIEDINGRSDHDGYDRAELNIKDRENSPKDQDFVEDFDGDEDFYGDDEENQSGASSYSDEKQPYIGKGDWVDSRYGENQYDHKDDVDYEKRQKVDPSAGFRKPQKKQPEQDQRSTRSTKNQKNNRQ